MRNPFLVIYDFFERRKPLLYISLALLVALSAVFAVRIQLEENISTFFKDENSGNGPDLLENFKLKDRIIVLLSGDDPDSLIAAADRFAEQVRPLMGEGLVKSVTGRVDQNAMAGNVDFVYAHLPVFLDDRDYERLEQSITPEGIREAVERSYSILTSPTGMVMGEVVKKDPLNIGTPIIGSFDRFNADLHYELYDGYIFSSDFSHLVLYIEPVNGMGETGNNERLVQGLESAQKASASEQVKIRFVGGPIVAVCNARQIKEDTVLTLSIALLVLIPLFLLTFRSRRTIFLILLPPAFGALSALALIALAKGSISAIAIGAGAIVLGIALSYSIHVISHSNHTNDPRKIIEELSYPLTLGCFTTIGAFVALMFTHSELLQDMGLFSALTLVGTTFFSLVYLPHFICTRQVRKKSRLLECIERYNGYAYEKSRWILLLISALTLLCLFFYNDVEFDSDMSNINYVPDDILQAEAELRTMMPDSCEQVFVISTRRRLEDACRSADELGRLYAELEQEGKLENYMEVSDFTVSPQQQRERIARWNGFWKEHGEAVLEMLEKEALAHGFRKEAFADFGETVSREYEVCGYAPGELERATLLSDWINAGDSSVTFVSQIHLQPQYKDEVYAQVAALGNHAVLDRSYFSSKMVTNTSNDFNFILWISSLLVFLALFISYGRIELTILTFLPMCISWVIILGFMALFGIRFNIVNIILATFIFGIGDDFSIFIMDGLLQRYRNGKQVMGAHKSAIFFSAFTTILGMGVLILAKHPAMKSIALMSVLGLFVVVLVAYTIQPFLFNLLIQKPADRKHYPLTFFTFLNSFYAFGFFFIGCVILRLYMLVLALCPVSEERRKALFHKLLYRITGAILKTVPSIHLRRENPQGEDFGKPVMMLANHQSFIDILVLLSTTPKLIMLTNSWVWKSPFFGKIVKYADFLHSKDGYEGFTELLRQKVAQGYSIAVFPEGTRSADCTIGRFHKGAFYLAEQLQLDLLPVVLYGPGLASAKEQGFCIKESWVIEQFMPRLPYGDLSMGGTYQARSKAYRQFYIREYARMEEKYSRAANPHFRQALMMNYIYKGPVIEWYMRIKCRIDGYYDFWDRLVPRDAAVTDMGCGYGQLALMLGMLSGRRKVTGIDYDAEKISLAANCFKGRDKVAFLHGDMCSVDLPESDVFIFNDSLHYMSPDKQEQVLQRCLERLKEGGQVIVRDGDCSNRHGHRAILATERWSTRILGFNKTSEPLQFVSRLWMEDFAARSGLALHVSRCNGSTSETFYILNKERQ